MYKRIYLARSQTESVLWLVTAWLCGLDKTERYVQRIPDAAWTTTSQQKAVTKSYIFIDPTEMLNDKKMS